MKRSRAGVVIILLLAVSAGAYFWFRPGPKALVLTGIVTTNDVVVSAQIAGQLRQLNVKEGDVVTAGQAVATIAPDELRADSAYYAHSAEESASQVQQSQAALRLQEKQTADSIAQARASLAAAEASQKSAEADLERARQMMDRAKTLSEKGVVSVDEFDQTRTAYDAAKARAEAMKKQADAARAAVSLAESQAEQTAMRRSQVTASQHQEAAAQAQNDKAAVRLAYTDVQAPIDGVVDVRAARQGEYVNAGQPIVTLINPDDLWVRVDVEETYIDRIKNGDTLKVRLPSGVEADGTVIFRGVDAGFATQRDVSRTKRDVKTFEIRLRVDNRDRHLALGMTVYVLLPVAP
jgi:multidrug resistance efflux pump